jgi:hypothetical protein
MPPPMPQPTWAEMSICPRPSSLLFFFSILRALVKTGDSSPIQMYPCRHHILYLTVANSIGIAILHGLAI